MPEGWKFPNGNPGTIWNLWWGGNPVERIGPYRFLRRWDVPGNDNSFRKAKVAVSEIITFSDHDEGSIVDIADMTLAAGDTMFRTGYLRLCTTLGYTSENADDDRKRIGSLSYHTVYDLICSYKKNRRVIGDV